jgi:ribonuclease P protein component
MSCYETLRRQQDFDRVFQQGRWRRTRAFALGVFERGDSDPARVGFVAGRGTGKSVQRNRARRRLREAFRQVVERPVAGADVVVLARGRVLDIKFAELTADMLKQVDEAGLLEGAAGSGDCQE